MVGSQTTLGKETAAETLSEWKEWDVMAPLLVETAKAHTLTETKEMNGTELKLKVLLLQKKRAGQHFERAELTRLCRANLRKRRALKREKHLAKIKESAEPRLHNANISTRVRLRNKRSPILTRPLLNSCGPKRHCPIREDSLDRAVEKLENGLCA